jgi:NAD(P)-dependent dehydrogenase (short-subunit alcohol dehydrogenase family)
MMALDFLIVIVSLKNIRIDLVFTSADLSSIPTAFALALGGLLDAEDIVELVEFLASPSAAYITSVNYVADFGTIPLP